jgi:hypothetical protein
MGRSQNRSATSCLNRPSGRIGRNFKRGIPLCGVADTTRRAPARPLGKKPFSFNSGWWGGMGGAWTPGSGLVDGEIMMSRQAFIVSVICLVFLLVLGLPGLFWPERIQTYALEHLTGPLHQKVNPFLTWMKTRQYIWSLRVIGTISLGAALLLLVILIKHLGL